MHSSDAQMLYKKVGLSSNQDLSFSSSHNNATNTQSFKTFPSISLFPSSFGFLSHFLITFAPHYYYYCRHPIIFDISALTNSSRSTYQKCIRLFLFSLRLSPRVLLLFPLPTLLRQPAITVGSVLMPMGLVQSLPQPPLLLLPLPLRSTADSARL